GGGDRGVAVADLRPGILALCGSFGGLDEGVRDAFVRRAHDDRFVRKARTNDLQDFLDLAPVGDGAPAKLHDDHGAHLEPAAPRVKEGCALAPSLQSTPREGRLPQPATGGIAITLAPAPPGNAKLTASS